MPVKIAKGVKNFFATSLPDGDKREFLISVNTINASRARTTALTFALLEVAMIAVHFLTNRQRLFDRPYIYYGALYLLMLAVMIVFIAVFAKLASDVPKNLLRIRVAGICFTVFILMWCAAISLLDQLSSGQVIVYLLAVISIAITPSFEPIVLLIIYLAVHILFLIALPRFQTSGTLLYANAVNTTTFMVIAWAIACMRYKSRAEDFKNRKTILEKNEQLRRINAKLQEVNQKLEAISNTDSLTGVINRLKFEKVITDEWNRCRRHAIPLSLIMVDMDFFKEYNDNYGHPAGDNCLKQIAGVLTVCAKRSSDKVARYGGDEFAVLLPHTDRESAIKLAEQMRNAVEEKKTPHQRSGVSDHVTISLGINTVVPSDDLSIGEFIRNADKALYKAKETRNRSEFFSEG